MLGSRKLEKDLPMSSKNLVISVENISKRFEIYEKPADRLKQFILPKAQNLVGKPIKKYFKEFCALDDVSFEVKQGEVVGIIGRNGSGKSTLLQIISGIMMPTRGNVKVHGRVAALLELGSGFNPEFTGRENVFMNASILGLSNEEIEKKYDEIVAFADIGEFIDRAVKTYSSGMLVRLAFSVQIHSAPDILIIDEALSVGDVAFQSKCYQQIEKLSQSGTSILFVTHSMDDIQRICNRGIVLEFGRKVIDAEPKRSIELYKKIIFGDKPEEKLTKSKFFSSKNTINSNHHYYGNEKIIIVDGGITSIEGEHTQSLLSGTKYIFYLKVLAKKDVEFPIYGFVIRDKYGLEICGTNTYFISTKKHPISQGTILKISFSFIVNLNSGTYFLGLNCMGFEGEKNVAYNRLAEIISFEVFSDKNMLGLYNLSANIDFELSENF